MGKMLTPPSDWGPEQNANTSVRLGGEWQNAANVVIVVVVVYYYIIILLYYYIIILL
jgi:hypothetical protein